MPAGAVGPVRRIRLAIAAGLLVSSAASFACAVCAPGVPLTVAQRMIDAERAVLAVPRDAGPPGWQVVATVKGDPQAEPPDVVPREPRAASAAPTLWVRDRLSRTWAEVGSVSVGRLEWLRSLGELPRTAEMTPEDWRARVAAFVPLLEDPEPMVAQTAYGEIARAPYAAMRANRERLDPARLAAWTQDATLGQRRPLYLLLLGLAGGPADANRIGRELAARRSSADPSDLPALIAADLELRGPARLPAIEKAWLLDPARSPAEVRAALVALSVHGEEGGAVSRTAVGDVFVRFARQRRSLAGLVAQDLAIWGRWEATPTFAALVDSPDVPIPLRIPMLRYLRESPYPEARAALERALRAPR